MSYDTPLRKPTTMASNNCLLFYLLLSLFSLSSTAKILTTLDGPFEPVTVPYDVSLRGNAVDLPETDSRVQRHVNGWEPEQISVSLSADYDSVWISWITGLFSIFFAFIYLILFLGFDSLFVV